MTPINFSETVKLVSLAIAEIFLSSPPTTIKSPTTNCAEKSDAVPVTVVESAAVVIVPAMSADCCRYTDLFLRVVAAAAEILATVPASSVPTAVSSAVTAVTTIPVLESVPLAPVISIISPTLSSSPKFVPVPARAPVACVHATVPVRVAEGRSEGHHEILNVFPNAPAHFAATDAVKLVAFEPPKSGS